MRPTPSWLLYAGLIVLLSGLVVLVFTWGRVAGLDALAEQVPYVISGGGAAIVLTLVGLQLIDAELTLRDCARQNRQLDELSARVEELRTHLGGERR